MGWNTKDEQPIHTSFAIAKGLDNDGFETVSLCYYDPNYGWFDDNDQPFSVEKMKLN